MSLATFPNDVTYDELTAVFGRTGAYAALKLIERSAAVSAGEVIDFDRAKRLTAAFDAMRAGSLAA